MTEGFLPPVDVAHSSALMLTHLYHARLVTVMIFHLPYLYISSVMCAQTK